jgi:cytochrome c oxidase subunit 2
MSLLVYIILILAAAAIWQLVRVVELSGKLKGVDPNRVTESDNRMQGRLMILMYFGLLIFCLWNFFAYKDKLLPVSASEHGVELDWLMEFNMYIIAVVAIVTNFLLFYMAYKYYGRDGGRATFYPHNNKLEMIWTGIPAVVLFIIIFFGITLWNDATSPAAKGSRVVELYSMQFNWKARYGGEDNTLGKSNYLLIDGVNELGVDSTDSKAADDVIVKDTLVLPVGEEVDFRFRSRDVIHSAYFPHFRAQMNCVPGMETYFHFKPTITTAKMREITKNPEFNYVLLCNKICGAAHYNMQMPIRIVEKAEYQKWMEATKASGSNGNPYYAKK